MEHSEIEHTKCLYDSELSYSDRYRNTPRKSEILPSVVSDFSEEPLPNTECHRSSEHFTLSRKDDKQEGNREYKRVGATSGYSNEPDLEVDAIPTHREQTFSGSRPGHAATSTGHHNMRGTFCRHHQYAVSGAGVNVTVNVYPKSSKRSGKQKRRYTITNSKKRLDDANMHMLCSQLGSNWRALGRKLGFHDGDLDRIEYDNRISGLSEVIWKLLYEYRERHHLAATLCAVADALIELKLYDIAALITEYG